jgi:hypothetical protein
MRLVLIAIALAACGRDDPPPAPRPPTPPVMPTPIVPPLPNVPIGETPISERPPCPETGPIADDMAVQVEWSSIRRTPGCWYFSGPSDVGRDDRLGPEAHWRKNGETATLSFGALAFSGSPVRLERTSAHDSGGRWTVTEVIEGQWQAATIARHETTPCPPSDATFTGTYRYNECEERARASCPGPCTITANIAIRPR